VNGSSTTTSQVDHRSGLRGNLAGAGSIVDVLPLGLAQEEPGTEII